jgi:hypothetical protein
MSGEHMHCIGPECPFVLVVGCRCCSVAMCNCKCTSKSKCGMRMCWRCGGEAHAPVTCAQVTQLREIVEDKSVMQNEWEMSNRNPCPKCKTRIAKNGGSSAYEFCWICGHRWWTHKGDSYACNSEQNIEDEFK